MEWAHQEGTVRPAGVPAPDTTRPTYADIDKGKVNVGVADRSPYLRSPSTETLPEVPHTTGSAIKLSTVRGGYHRTKRHRLERCSRTSVK